MESVLAFFQNEFWIEFVITAIKIVLVFTVCAQIPPFMVWFERRAPAYMQRRKGPNRVGLFGFRLFGLIQPLADTIKLIFKEEVVPTGAHKVFYHLAPVFSLFTSLLVAAAIPFGPPIEIFGRTITLSVVNLDVGFLFIFALSSLGVYGVTLAGYASNNKYSLMGALRASAQMISYEIPLGLSLIPIVIIFGTLDLNTIVLGQESILSWGIFKAPVSFFLFVIAMFAETNRAPFDLAESEAELVAGFHTEYNSFKFSLFYFGEYVSMFVLSCLASICFFGGWQTGFINQEQLTTIFNGIVPALPLIGQVGQILAVLVGVLMTFIKASFFMWLFVWVRWTLPRFRYDQLMNLGWKFMMPIGLANILITAIILGAASFK